MNYIIFDLEATCWEKSNGKVSEIIEIGAVKLASNLEVIYNDPRNLDRQTS